MCTLLTQLT